MKEEDIKDAVDYVMTFEELQAVFDAREIDLGSLEEENAGDPSSFGRIFARTGGVSESVRRVAKLENVEAEFNPVRCNGIDECIKALRLASFGRLEGNFIEGMVCKNGCTGGAASLTHENRDIEKINTYGRQALTDNPAEGIGSYNMEGFSMKRDFDLYMGKKEEEPPKKKKRAVVRRFTAKAPEPNAPVVEKAPAKAEEKAPAKKTAAKTKTAKEGTDTEENLKKMQTTLSETISAGSGKTEK